MRCPSLDDITTAVLSLLPRGRAWQTNEGLPRPGYDAAFAPHAFAADAFQTEGAAKSILWQYWRAFAEVVHFLNARLCALREEFWCASHVETNDGWMREYGLPDDCDPFPDLCTKVAAIGGTRCEYYQAIAARMGWSIECVEEYSDCGSQAGDIDAQAGEATAGAVIGRSTLKIVVHLDESPAITPEITPLPLAGQMQAGTYHMCEPDITPLQCLMSRIIHAEIFTVYEGRTNG